MNGLSSRAAAPGLAVPAAASGLAVPAAASGLTVPAAASGLTALAAASGLTALAAASGLTVLAAAEWPAGIEPPRLAGFVHSDFSPLVAAVAGRCLQAMSGPPPAGAPASGPPVSTVDDDTALVLVSDLGDVESAAHVARAVDEGTRVGPLFFFQSVPNAVLGRVAAKWALSGPVSCVCDPVSGLDTARGLLADGDAGRVLLIELVRGARGDTAAAVLVARGGASDGTNGGVA
jgi:hypothetical protein